MPTLNLTYSASNKCYVKSIGYWMSNGKRTPRHFHFRHPNTKEGLAAAQAELLPILNQWLAIKAKAKAEGREPIWYREKAEKPTKATATPHSPYGFGGRLDKDVVAEANEAANPNKPLDDATTVANARKAYLTAYGLIAKPSTLKGTTDVLALILRPLEGLPMASLDAGAVVDGFITRVSQGTLRARTAHSYSRILKTFIEWYSKATKKQLAYDWNDTFKKSRFRNPHTADVIFNEDGTENDFLVYTTKDLKTVFDNCNTDRQRLYVLLALNAGCYYVDIAHALRTKNIHLDNDKPFLLYRREKESHHENPIIQKVWLWEETANLLKQEMNKGSEYPNALLSEDGKPMTKKGPEETWGRLADRLKKLKAFENRILRGKVCIRYTDLRKTGGSAISNIAGVDLGELHLGHKVDGIGAKYIKLSKKRLYKPMMKWRQRLIKGGVFESMGVTA